MHFVRNGKKCKMHKIDWCEGGLQLAYIGTKNVSEPDITPRMEYIWALVFCSYNLEEIHFDK